MRNNNNNNNKKLVEYIDKLCIQQLRYIDVAYASYAYDASYASYATDATDATDDAYDFFEFVYEIAIEFKHLVHLEYKRNKFACNFKATKELVSYINSKQLEIFNYDYAR